MITPTQRRLIDEHRARRRAWAASAYKAPPPPPPPKREEAPKMRGILVKEGIDWVYREVPVVEAPPLTAEPHVDLTPNVRKIVLRTVATYYNILPSDILSKRRQRTIVTARGFVYHFLRKELPGFSLPAIGRLMGGRDHTTILYGYQKVKNNPADFAEIVHAAEAILFGETAKNAAV